MKTILDGIVDDKILKILKTLSKHNKDIYHLNKLSKQSKVPIATTSRIMKTLVKQDIAETIKVGKIRLYRLKKTDKTKEIQRLLGVA